MLKFFNQVTKKLTYDQYTHSLLCFNNSKNVKWFIYRAELPKDHINEIIDDFNNKLEKPLDTIDFEQNSTDNVYEFNGNNLLQNDEIRSAILGITDNNAELLEEQKSFTIETAEKLPPTTKIESVIHVFEHNEKQILLFSKHQGSSLLKKKFYSYTESEFQEINKSNLYLFNSEVTCAWINNNYYIFNVDKFYGIFKYWDKLKEIRNEVVEDIRELNIVSNFEEYRDIYDKFYNMKSIIKIKEAKMDLKKYLKDNKDRFEEICTANDLYLIFDKDTESFNITGDEGVTVLNRILSGRSGHHLSGHFITFPSFIGYQKKEIPKKKIKRKSKNR